MYKYLYSYVEQLNKDLMYLHIFTYPVALGFCTQAREHEIYLQHQYASSYLPSSDLTGIGSPFISSAHLFTSE